jgi:hypothetical protein
MNTLSIVSTQLPKMVMQIFATEAIYYYVLKGTIIIDIWENDEIKLKSSVQQVKTLRLIHINSDGKQIPIFEFTTTSEQSAYKTKQTVSYLIRKMYSDDSWLDFDLSKIVFIIKEKYDIELNIESDVEYNVKTYNLLNEYTPTTSNGSIPLDKYVINNNSDIKTIQLTDGILTEKDDLYYTNKQNIVDDDEYKYGEDEYYDFNCPPNMFYKEIYNDDIDADIYNMDDELQMKDIIDADIYNMDDELQMKDIIDADIYNMDDELQTKDIVDFKNEREYGKKVPLNRQFFDI